MSGHNEHGAAYFEKMLNIIDVGVHLIDREGITIFYNDKMAETDGLKREQVVGKNFFELFPSLTNETSTFMKVLQTGIEIREKIQTYVSVTGKRITTINSTYPLLENGDIIGALEVAKDITSIVHLHDQILDLRHQIYESPSKDKKHTSSARYHFSDLIGNNEDFLRTISFAKKASRTSSPVLICGPTGTGKELVAQSIHNAGARRSRLFIAQNCAAVPNELMEGIMFGTARGAFTGAIDRAGLFEQANGGTLFLDELNSLDLILQAKLLRVLQDGLVRRVGGTQEQQVDVRIITAMNIDPKEALDKGLLRSDLFYRLNVVNLTLPPLAGRKEDIPILTNHFIDTFNDLFGMKITGIAPAAMQRLLDYHWPGNIRELSHAIESTYNMMELECEIIEETHLPASVMGIHPLRYEKQHEAAISTGLTDKVKQLEKEAIVNALTRHHYNITLTAQALGIKRQALQYKLNRYGIVRKP
ncbi:sigma 54-interacting transcriptional regulator [Paenibacillus sp. CGMCC 1.16610]|uniref:PAS domain S-box protein n=1 Tax=Paenibacillus anseongense TaxID=2682845 RepID=A0ABW9UE60_9BACL|nr:MULTISPECIES: sigma 54-interacting transcriptional regulator [Paenibacillus]MBA2941937.1 sigma 54-interacting transcriptional regulator [Paenibacillus sp. CGMCC 1.16610]MVQ38424.1 PAS domain S-box protein [Paenibacillus anseongense]